MNGNITNLYRTSILEYGNTTPTLIDNLEYIYDAGNNSNRLSKINDYSYNATGYEGGGQTIGYDVNGNMTDMPDKAINTIKYNYLNLSDKVEYSRNGNETVIVNMKYGAGGEKLQKENITTIIGFNSTVTTKKITDYLDGFQYLQTVTPPPVDPGGGGSSSLMPNSETAKALEMQAFSLDEPVVAFGPMGTKTADLQFFPTAEGFYDYVKNQYIYQYKDHLGNVRVSFGKTSAGALEIVDNNDYYPFGMNHLKSGTSFFGTSSYKNYKYQGQELQETGFYSFKWRNYMPDVGRFFNIDPLAEKFLYNSTYAFSENRVIDGRELEGLEWVASRNLEEKTVNLHLTYKLTNNTINALTDQQVATLAKEREQQIISSFGGKDSEGNQVNITFTQSDKASIIWDYNMGYDLTGVEGADNLNENDRTRVLATTDGLTDKIGDTQSNRTQIGVGRTTGIEWTKDGYIDFTKDRSAVAVTGAHEDGHVLGLKHNDKETVKNPKSLMRESQSPGGTQISPTQRTQVIKLVEDQKKKTK